ncbi:hypothetical protein [Ralstonia solanacearum]|uniref:hypothetical protein n=1 Tax=Ralstonia solanacearum TaxID=305 RepID=UPI003CC6ABF9
MSNPISVEPQKTALLLMDFQEFALKNFLTGTVAADVVEHASRLLAAARTAGVFVVHVTVTNLLKSIVMLLRIGTPADERTT